MEFSALENALPELKTLARKFGIAKLYVFGSVARGEQCAGSDVDFLVEMAPNRSLFGAAGFSYEAEKLLGVPVDVIPRSTLPELEDREFVARVEAQAVLV